MNLVMIGEFRNIHDAEQAKRAIDRLTSQVHEESHMYRADAEPHQQRFSDAMMDVLSSLKLYGIGPAELEQFGYQANVKVDGSNVIITTDEIEVSAFLKVLIDKGARVQVYSAHEYPDTEHGR
jgi:hypothetical protein